MPVVGAVTSTITVQLELAGMLMPVKLTLAVAVAPAALGMAPVQVPRPAPMKFWAAVTVVIAPGDVGKVSLKLTAETVVPFGLVRVKVMVEVPPAAIEDGENASEMATYPRTVRFALGEGAPAMGVCALVAPLVAVGHPASGLMFALATWTVTVQVPFAGTVRPEKARLVAPAAKLLPAAPMQVPAAAAVA